MVHASPVYLLRNVLHLNYVYTGAFFGNLMAEVYAPINV